MADIDSDDEERVQRRRRDSDYAVNRTSTYRLEPDGSGDRIVQNDGDGFVVADDDERAAS